MHNIFSRFLPHSRGIFLQRALAFLPVLALLLANTALAQDAAAGGAGAISSLGAIFCSAYSNVNSLGNLFEWFCVVAGLYFGIRGVMVLKDHSENPQQHPLHKAMLYFIAATCMISINSFVGMLVQTFFTVPGGSGSTACSAAVADNGTNASVTLDVMMTNMVSNIKEPMMLMLAMIAQAMGLYLIIRGLMRASKHGTDPRTHSLTNIYTSFIIGAMLCAIGPNLTNWLQSIFGVTTTAASSNLLEWAAFKNNGVSPQFATAVQAALTFFQLIGFISFIRGWTILRQAVEGQGQHTVSQGLTHIIGGVVAINIYGFLPILDKTFGTSFTSS